MPKKLLTILMFLLMGQSFAHATKPEISLEPMVKRAGVIVSGRVDDVQELALPRKDDKGDWLPARHKIMFTPDITLKGDLEEKSEFISEGLTFEKNQNYVFFLTAIPGETGKPWHYISGPVKLVPVDEATLHEIKELSKRNN